MSFYQQFAAALMLAATVPIAHGQAIVDATGATGGSVTTIGEALAGTEAEIIVKNTGVYHEALTITRDVVLRGEDPNDPPTIAMQPLAEQPTLGPGDGIYIGGTSGGSASQNITFKDFIIIPDMSNGPTDDAITVTPNAGAVLTLTVNNVLCAPNDGTDKPAATSVWDDLDVNAGGIAKIPDDGFYMVDEQFAGFDGVVVLNLTDVKMLGVGGDAFVLYTGDNGGGSFTGTGLEAGFAGRYAAQVGDPNPITLTGTKEHPSWVARSNAVGILLFQGGITNIDNLITVDNADCGLRVDPDTVESLTMTNSLLANNFYQGIIIKFSPAVAHTWTISDCTFFSNDSGGNGIPSIEVTSAVDANLTLNVTDCIFAGPGSEAIGNAGTAAVTADNCAFVTAGPVALPGTNTGVTETGSINDDPGFVSVDTNPIVDGSFDVTAATYAAASSTGGPLNGWGEGPVLSSVIGWSIY